MNEDYFEDNTLCAPYVDNDAFTSTVNGKAIECGGMGSQLVSVENGLSCESSSVDWYQEPYNDDRNSPDYYQSCHEPNVFYGKHVKQEKDSYRCVLKQHAYKELVDGTLDERKQNDSHTWGDSSSRGSNSLAKTYGQSKTSKQLQGFACARGAKQPIDREQPDTLRHLKRNRSSIAKFDSMSDSFEQFSNDFDPCLFEEDASLHESRYKPRYNFAFLPIYQISSLPFIKM